MPFSPQTTEIRLNNLEGQKTMTKSQHTPGPWFIGFGGREQDDYAVICSKHSDRAICNLEPRDYNQANARLIAAAPELLEALRNVCNGLYALRDHAQQEYGVAASVEQRLINECISAIAKAEGK